MGIALKFRNRKGNSSSCVYLLPNTLWSCSDNKECTYYEKCTARAKLLFFLLKWLLLCSRCRHRLALLLNLPRHGSNTVLQVSVTSLKMHGWHLINFLFWHLNVSQSKTNIAFFYCSKVSLYCLKLLDLITWWEPGMTSLITMVVSVHQRNFKSICKKKRCKWEVRENLAPLHRLLKVLRCTNVWKVFFFLMCYR